MSWADRLRPDGKSYGLTLDALVRCSENIPDKDGVLCYKAKLGDNDVSVRYVPNNNPVIMLREMTGFRRSRPVDNERNFQRTLQGLYMFEEATGCHFIYDHYEFTLQSYFSKITQKRLWEANWLRMIRATFCALWELHNRNESHGNLKSDMKIVLVDSSIFKIELAALGHPSVDKSVECESLANLLDSYTTRLQPSYCKKKWFTSIMDTLRLPKLRNLHNSLMLLEAQQKIEYLSEAGRRVLPFGSRFINEMFADVTGADTWMGKVTNDSGLFREVLYFEKEETETDIEFQRRCLRNSKNAKGFLKFCRDFASHSRHTTVAVNEQWNRLYEFWPNFFDVLHYKLVQKDIYILELKDCITYRTYG